MSKKQDRSMWHSRLDRTRVAEAGDAEDKDDDDDDKRYAKFRLLKNEKDRLDAIKYKMCRLMVRISLQDGYSRQRLARRLGTTESTVSYVLSYRLDKVSFNQLFCYLVQLRSDFDILIAV